MFYVYLVKQYLESEPLPADTANAVLAEAYKYQGWKYVQGGSSPQTSFDFSRLTQWCFGQAGVSLPRTAQEQYEAVQHLELEEAQPGDLVFSRKHIRQTITSRTLGSMPEMEGCFMPVTRSALQT